MKQTMMSLEMVILQLILKTYSVIMASCLIRLQAHTLHRQDNIGNIPVPLMQWTGLVETLRSRKH